MALLKASPSAGVEEGVVGASGRDRRGIEAEDTLANGLVEAQPYARECAVPQ
jgi:hypothetical protein